MKIERQIYCEASKEILNFRVNGENVRLKTDKIILI
ncbi:hypothetical protein LRU_01043 [Ligilactobacillus ruminis SPM0211]|uniref:Uncharacterized protein n=1 Tax=Ligilactobacillus ruminis SPM0211 TaxID=1040964 RepID=F7R035_9LACO|nr:hypothetical protein LRU_01043 [Ligilactobacillus ruminis SPM0211]